MTWVTVYGNARKRGLSKDDAMHIAALWEHDTKERRGDLWFGVCRRCGEAFKGLRRSRFCSVKCAMPEGE